MVTVQTNQFFIKCQNCESVRTRQHKYNYRPQRSWAKVIFLYLSVILLMGGCGLVMGVSNFSGEGLQFLGMVSNFSREGGEGSSNFFKFFFQFFFPKKISAGMHQPTPPETVYEWPVRILLEYILV